MSLKSAYAGVECPRFGADAPSPAPAPSAKPVRTKRTPEVAPAEDIKSTRTKKVASVGRPRLPDAERIARRKAQKAAANARRKGSAT